MAAVVILTTVNSGHDAEHFARELVGKRLAACVNIIPGVQSVYRWRENVECDSEFLLLIKTTEERVAALKLVLFDLHPYEVPEFVVLPVDRVEEPYASWLSQQVTPDGE
ncbi:MAG TPA: divalent-cation tolerance protein CutA [Thermoanaerobaculia bacterium]|nr:divalent-cation tolerance protein CutA [Thermoanaerobaculia bacterium]